MYQLQNTSGTKKRWVHTCKNITSFLLLLFLVGCQNASKQAIEGFEFTGDTQGTTYRIIIAEEQVNFEQQEIDSLLHAFDLSLSTYLPESVISQLNANQGRMEIIDSSGFFKRCYQQSEQVFQASQGAFDPSVFPLVEGWGFMRNVETPLSKEKIDSIMRFISFEQGKLHRIEFLSDTIVLEKLDARFKLDFNAIAQGLSVDVLSDFLKSRGHKHFYVEIGGELQVKGLNREGLAWKIGIDVPKEKTDDEVRQLENVISVSGKAIATSGNYRKFYEVDGKKYAHTLNPKTGYPVKHSLLSATVITDECSFADAYATVFMVMGVERTKSFLIAHPELKLDVYLLYDDQGSIARFVSPGFMRYMN
jgi:thiamine biosynthesis lipoprotein